MTLSAILAFLCAHGPELTAAAYALLNLANALARGPEAKGFLMKLADLLSVLTRKDAAGTLKMPLALSASSPKPPAGGKPPLNLVALALVGLGLSSCAHVPPSLKQYGQVFGACMESKGLAEAPGLASQVFDILDKSAGSAGTIEQQLEGLLSAQGFAAAKDVGECAIVAWLSNNPVAGKPSPAQGAARVFLARRAAARPAK